MINIKGQIMNATVFPLRTIDKIRYADTDRQGHVNNAVFGTFLETGRVEILYDDSLGIRSENASFVIANLNINFRREIVWPGEVEILTGIKKVGNSSIKIYQEIHQNQKVCADAETTIVQVKEGQSEKLSDLAKVKLETWRLKTEA